MYFSFYILEGCLLSFECYAAMTGTDLFYCMAIHNNFHIIKSFVSTLTCHLLTPTR